MPIRKWGTEQVVNAPTQGNHTDPRVVALVGGGFVVVWVDDGGPADNSVKFQRYDAAGSKVGAETLVIDEPDDQYAPTVGAFTDGGFVILLTDQTNGSPGVSTVQIRRYDPNGVLTFSGGEASTTFEGQASVIGNGTAYAYVWQDPSTNSGDIKFRARSFANTNISGEIVVNAARDGVQAQPDLVVIPNDGNYVVAWTSAGQVFFRMFDRDVSALGGDVRVDTAGVGTVAVDREVDVAVLATGGFVVTWTAAETTGPNAGSSVRAALYDRNGALLRADFQVNSFNYLDQMDSEAIGTRDGGFVILWNDISSFSTEVRLQLFDAFGQRVGSEYVVGKDSSSSASALPSVTMLADGRLAVAFSAESDGGKRNIVVQIIDPRDGAVFGTTNADTLYGADGVSDEITAYDGADVVFGMTGDDVIYAGAGADLTLGGNGDDVVFAGSGADTVNGGHGDDVVFGDAAADVLFGEVGADNLAGGEGADTLNGGDGADGLLGGTENDVLVGEAGNDALYGGAGGDVLLGGADHDTLVGEDGADQLLGEAGDDTVVAGAGADQLFGGLGADVLNGGADGDVLRGDDGDDVLVGEDGGDDLQGGAGSDTLFGDLGGDALFGGDGGDVLIGGAGGDLLSGGAGADIFWFRAPSDGVDVIQDFASGLDKIWLTSTAFNLPLGSLNPANFVAGASPAASAAAPTILYNTNTGALSYDPDGAGPQGALVLAIMSGPLSASDFLMVS